MQEQHSKPDHDQDQDHDQETNQLWQAFLYVSGELSADDEQKFEDQMLVEPLLCEAVVDASRLTTAVADGLRFLPSSVVPTVAATGLKTTLATTNRRPIRSRREVFTACAAVCCCLAAVLMTVQFAATPEAQISGVQPTDAEQLVDAWADSYSNEFATEADHGDFEQQQLNVPDWMMAAVSLDAAGESGGGVDGDGVEADWF